MEHLDDTTLDEIARLVCGDDVLVYRKGWEIHEFLKRAQWNDVPEYDGSPRRAWVLGLLRKRQATSPGVERVILRLADPREYRGEPQALSEAIDALNGILGIEGWQVDITNGRPALLESEVKLDPPSRPRPVELKVTVADIVRDKQLAAVLQRRLDEARICHENGAHIATVILLGGLLEGVLIDATMMRLERPVSRPIDRMSLNELIEVAHSQGWIDVDVHKGGHLLRSYRNLVHPYEQVRLKHAPDGDTVDICWPIVNATLNDLAATAPRGTAE